MRRPRLSGTALRGRTEAVAPVCRPGRHRTGPGAGACGPATAGDRR